jgi:uncharacterized protein
MFERNWNFEYIEEGYSYFFWGPRQTGKSTLLKSKFPESIWLDLLKSDVFQMLSLRPQALREIIASQPEKKIIIIDEVQKIPQLLDEVHWLIENERKTFILSGSSPRKIIHKNVNLLGGRAIRAELFPLSYSEIPDFNLLKALNDGLIPRHYLSSRAKPLIGAYLQNYLETEIAIEARIRNVSLFSNFLHKAAFSNGDLINYTNIAADCGVSSPTVKEYFQILVDSMIGRYIQPFHKKQQRKEVGTPKFYFFDIGIVNQLLKREKIEFGSENIGYAFEHFIYMELQAYSQYSLKKFPISFWRTHTQLEVDFILGNAECAIEVKSSEHIQSKHLKNLKAFCKEYDVKHAIVVCNESIPRLVDNIQILPWKLFLDKLWAGEWI